MHRFFFFLCWPLVCLSKFVDQATNLFVRVLKTIRELMILFVCVEVLRPSQPNGVMLSAVGLPNHTFPGQA